MRNAPFSTFYLDDHILALIFMLVNMFFKKM